MLSKLNCNTGLENCSFHILFFYVYPVVVSRIKGSQRTLYSCMIRTLTFLSSYELELI